MILLLGLLLSSIVMLVVWLLYLKTNNPAIIDAFWSVNIFAISIFYVLLQPTSLRTILISLTLFAWALRLFTFLYVTRLKKHEIDKRYLALSNGWQNKPLGFLLNYQVQGFLAWLISFPFFFIPETHDISLFDIILLFSILICLTLEHLADLTLLQFKKGREKGVCQKGLWAYSRHPNLFFEWMIWLGFGLLGTDCYHIPWALLSPLVLFLVMRFITIPLSETQSLSHRKDAYSTYQKKTNCFFPFLNK